MPIRLLIISFISLILLGTFLLYLPISQITPISFIDSFFTATSATCVTGLATVPLSYFSFLGQLIILILIQLGGLGILTFSLFIIYIFFDQSLELKIITSKILNYNLWLKVKSYLIFIIFTSFFFEILGAISLYPIFRQNLDKNKAIFYSIFHSISAFCNSGYSLFDNNLTNYSCNYNFLLIIIFLSFIGSIGFIVWHDLFYIFKKKLSLHSKIVLSTTFILILFGTIFIFFIEKNNSLKEFNNFYKILNSLFLSISSRSVGFNTINFANLYRPSLLIFTILMFIGGAANSTAGGIKVTTFAIICATIKSVIKNKTNVEIFSRTIPVDQIYKALAIIILNLFLIFMTTFLLLLTDHKFSFLQILFESVSAITISGFSTGITPFLSFYSKIILITAMFIGRIGFLTLIISLGFKSGKNLYKYPEERVLL